MAVMNAASLRDAQTAADSVTTSTTTQGPASVATDTTQNNNSTVVTSSGYGLARTQTQQTNPLHD